MTERTHEKINETVIQVCKNLGIPYDPHSSMTDPRAMIISNALFWIASDVERQVRAGA